MLAKPISVQTTFLGSLISTNITWVPHSFMFDLLVKYQVNCSSGSCMLSHLMCIQTVPLSISVVTEVTRFDLRVFSISFIFLETFIIFSVSVPNTSMISVFSIFVSLSWCSTEEQPNLQVRLNMAVNLTVMSGLLPTIVTLVSAVDSVPLDMAVIRGLPHSYTGYRHRGPLFRCLYIICVLRFCLLVKGWSHWGKGTWSHNNETSLYCGLYIMCQCWTTRWSSSIPTRSPSPGS